jgi:hypothetical protein
MTAIRPLSARRARLLTRFAWRRLLRFTGARTFVRTGTSGDVTVLSVRGDVRGVFVDRLESLGFAEEVSA